MSSRRSILGSALDVLPPPTDPLRELFEACKTGDAIRVKKLITAQTVNARDTAGRKSTPLHFAAGIRTLKTYLKSIICVGKHNFPKVVKGL